MRTETHAYISLQFPIQCETLSQHAICFRSCILRGLFDPEDGGDVFVRNIG
jgi:hypothetical protein